MAKDKLMNNEFEDYYEITDILLEEALDRSIKVYGLEGTEDVIKRVYSHPNLQKVRNLWLTELYRRYK